jgi:5'-nucleotidase
MSSERKIWSSYAAIICLGLIGFIYIVLQTLSVPSAAQAKQPEVAFCMTVFHNNDGESRLIDAGRGLKDFGGAARFATVLEKLRFKAEFGPHTGLVHQCTKRGIVTLSSGDNFRGGPEFTASLEKGIPFFDTIALDLIQYDALALGNHEFDFGPDVLADFIEGFSGAATFLSANLDFSREPRLQNHVDRGHIAKSAVLLEQGELIGVVGATTDQLPIISSPRRVRVHDVAPSVQKEIDRLEETGVNKIILISHLQSIQDDFALASQLRGVDIIIAGGGGDLLANEGDVLIPDDEEKVFGPYPLWADGADGRRIPVVTTAGNYKYVGRLVVGFDRMGHLTAIDEEESGPIRVAGGDNPDAVLPAPFVQSFVVKPVMDAVAEFAANVVGNSEVGLDGIRENVRTTETNEGNLIADAVLWQGMELADQYGVPMPDVALINGGAIRNDTIIAGGNITELDTFNILPFANFVTIVPNVSRHLFKEILENSVSQVEHKKGRFAQISGFHMIWDSRGKPRLLDDNRNVVWYGSRVVGVTLNDGTVIVTGGAVVPGPPLNITTIDFLARGGDQYPFGDAPFTTLGVTYQQAIANYIQRPLRGIITGAQYPEGGEGRISRLTTISTWPPVAKSAPIARYLSVVPRW